MKKYFVLLSSIIMISCSEENPKEIIVADYIQFVNEANRNKIDSILSFDFKYINDSIVEDKTEFLKGVKSTIDYFEREIIEIETNQNVVKTKENLLTNVNLILDIPPVSRKREYHFNENNKIKSIYNLETIIPPDNILVANNLFKWALIEYPSIYKIIAEKSQKNENANDEIKYLLTKLNEKGINILNEIENLETNEGDKSTKKRKDTDYTFVENINKLHALSKEYTGKKVMLKLNYNSLYMGSLALFEDDDYSFINVDCSDQALEYVSKIKTGNKCTVIGIVGIDILGNPEIKNAIIYPVNYKGQTINIFITPGESFLSSLVITPFGMNYFPFGEFTIKKMVSELSNTVLSNGKKPIINGWTKSNNIYILHVKMMDEDVQFIFTHLLDKDGEGSIMKGKISGQDIEGVQMLRLIPSLIE